MIWPGVGGIGDRLLVAGHRGVEDDLAGDLAAGPEQLAVESGAVLEQDVAAHATFAFARPRIRGVVQDEPLDAS